MSTMHTPQASTFLRRLRGDDGGVALVEMALSLPLLMLLCLGMIDISRLVTAKIDLEQSALQATDLVLAKRPSSNKTAAYQKEAADAAGVATSQVTVEFILECDGIKASAFDDECADGETVARFAYVSIHDNVETEFVWGEMASFFDGVDRASTVKVVGDSTVRFQ